MCREPWPTCGSLISVTRLVTMSPNEVARTHLILAERSGDYNHRPGVDSALAEPCTFDIWTGDLRTWIGNAPFPPTGQENNTYLHYGFLSSKLPSIYTSRDPIQCMASPYSYRLNHAIPGSSPHSNSSLPQVQETQI